MQLWRRTLAGVLAALLVARCASGCARRRRNPVSTSTCSRRGADCPIPRRSRWMSHLIGRTAASIGSEEAQSEGHDQQQDLGGVVPLTPAPLPISEREGPTVDAPLGLHRPLRHRAARGADRNQRFVPVEDRWRIGFPEWDRYGKGHPPRRRLPVRQGPLVGPVQPERPQGRLPDHRPAHLPRTSPARASRCSRAAQVPTADDAVREHRAARSQPSSSAGPTSSSYQQFFVLSFDLFHGDAAFKPVDWRVKLTPVFNVNYLAVRGAGRRQPRRAAGAPTAAARFMALRGVVRRDEARRPRARTTTSCRCGPARSRSSATSAASSSATSTAASACSATATPTATSSTSPTSDQPEKDTNSGLNTLRRPRPERRSSPTTTARTSSSPATRRRSSVHYNNDEPTLQVRQERLPGPARPGRRLPAARARRRLPRLGRRRAHRPLQHHARVLLGARPRQRSTRSPASAQDISAQMAAARAVVRPRLGPLPHVVLLGVRRRRPEQQPRHAASTPSSTTRTSPAASSATGSGRRSALFGVNLAQPREPGARPAVEQDPGAEQLRQPRPVPGQRRRRLRPDAEAAARSTTSTSCGSTRRTCSRRSSSRSRSSSTSAPT